MTESMRKYIRGGLTAAFSVAALPLAAAGAQAADLRCGIDPHRATVGARHPEGREFRRGSLWVVGWLARSRSDRAQAAARLGGVFFG